MPPAVFRSGWALGSGNGRGGSLLEEAMTPARLNAAWRRLRNEHTPWSEKVTRDELQWNFVEHLLALREEVLGGSYRPAPLRHFPMRKPDGRQRILTAQYLKDKLAQRALLSVLEGRAEKVFHEDSYAYRPGRGTQQALRKARERIRCGLDWLVDADIKQFFDSIPHGPLLKMLRRFVRDRDAMRLIEMWLRQGAHSSSLLGARRGIAQGAILSPLMCNLYLTRFDDCLARMNIPFVRFADDFLLFCPTREKAQAALRSARQSLEKLDLELHPDKTRIIRSGPQVVFLGEKLPNPSR